jgi:ketohexokinase
MAKILAVGIATIDIINSVDAYPAENSEVRVISQRQVRGGNATNTLTVLSQLGNECFWAGVLIDEPDAQVIKQDLSLFNIDFSTCTVLTSGKMPTSYISHNKNTGSRTIVHHRDCPEFSFADFKKIDLKVFGWIHFEGRNITETTKMFQWLDQHHPDLPYSLEVEKPRPDIETLFNYPQVLMFSQHYAEAHGYKSAPDLLHTFADHITASCTWGAQGAWAKSGNVIIHKKAKPPEYIIDTLGAGDTFNAGLISALIQKDVLEQALTKACQLASNKCGQLGFAQLTF